MRPPTMVPVLMLMICTHACAFSGFHYRSVKVHTVACVCSVNIWCCVCMCVILVIEKISPYYDNLCVIKKGQSISTWQDSFSYYEEAQDRIQLRSTSRLLPESPTIRWLLCTEHITQMITCHGSQVHLSQLEMVTPAVNEQNMIQEFWRKRQEEIEVIEDFGERAFPMTRLRKLICAEKGKMMMSFDTPSFLTKACEIFVQEITFRAWICAMSHNRGIIVDSDIAEAIASTQSYDFLKDVLLDNQEEHNSEPCPNPTKKCHHGLEDHPCTSQQQPPPHQYQMPQFSHQLTSCPSYVSIPPPLPPTNVHDMTLPLPFLPQEVPALRETTITLPTPIVSEVMIPPINYISGDVGSFQNNINNNVSDFVVINPLQVLPGAPPFIPNNHFMSMVPSACEYDIGSASTSIVAAQNGGVALHSPCDLSIGMQLPSPSTVANNIGPTSTNISELDNTLPGVNEAVGAIQVESTLNTYGMIDPEATICVTNSQQQHQEGEAIAGPALNNVVHGSLDAEVTTTNVGRNNDDISLEEFDMVDDSLLDEYWDAFLLDEDPAPWPNPTSTGDVLPLHIDMPDLQGFSQESHLLDAIVRGANTGSR